MRIKFCRDHKIVDTDTCGEIREILSGGEYSSLDLAVALDIAPTTAHFHQTFDEIYFVLDGSVTMKIFDPLTKEVEEHRLQANELCVIDKGVHHRITQASEKNRLCVISTPRWLAGDEHLSNMI